MVLSDLICSEPSLYLSTCIQSVGHWTWIWTQGISLHFWRLSVPVANNPGPRVVQSRLRMPFKIIRVQWRCPTWPLPTFLIYRYLQSLMWSGNPLLVWQPAQRPAHGAAWFHSLLLQRQKHRAGDAAHAWVHEWSIWVLSPACLSTRFYVSNPRTQNSISKNTSVNILGLETNTRHVAPQTHHKLARLKSGWNNRNGLVSTGTPLVARGCPLPPWLHL